MNKIIKIVFHHLFDLHFKRVFFSVARYRLFNFKHFFIQKLMYFLFLKNFQKKYFGLIKHRLVFYEKHNASKGPKKNGFFIFSKFKCAQFKYKNLS